MVGALRYGKRTHDSSIVSPPKRAEERLRTACALLWHEFALREDRWSMNDSRQLGDLSGHAQTRRALKWWHLLIGLACVGFWTEYMQGVAQSGRHYGPDAIFAFGMLLLVFTSPLVVLGMLIRDWFLLLNERVGSSWILPRVLWEVAVVANFACVIDIVNS